MPIQVLGSTPSYILVVVMSHVPPTNIHPQLSSLHRLDRAARCPTSHACSYHLVASYQLLCSRCTEVHLKLLCRGHLSCLYLRSVREWIFISCRIVFKSAFHPSQSGRSRCMSYYLRYTPSGIPRSAHLVHFTLASLSYQSCPRNPVEDTCTPIAHNSKAGIVHF